jgi:putative hydrolase
MGRSRPAFFHFSELTAANANRDFQVHTNWTDGEAPIAAVLQKAVDCQLREIAFTEHARATSTYYPEFFSEIIREKQQFPLLAVYAGFEVKVIDDRGTLDITDSMREEADIILGSVHGIDGKPAVQHPREHAIEREFALASAIVRHSGADVLSHPGGMCLRTYGHFPLHYFEELMVLSRKHGVAFEINWSYHRSVLGDLIPLLKRYDPIVSIGSDVHRLADMGACRNLLRTVLDLS